MLKNTDNLYFTGQIFNPASTGKDKYMLSTYAKTKHINKYSKIYTIHRGTIYVPTSYIGSCSDMIL